MSSSKEYMREYHRRKLQELKADPVAYAEHLRKHHEEYVRRMAKLKSGDGSGYRKYLDRVNSRWAERVAADPGLRGRRASAERRRIARMRENDPVAYREYLARAAEANRRHVERMKAEGTYDGYLAMCAQKLRDRRARARVENPALYAEMLLNRRIRRAEYMAELRKDDAAYSEYLRKQRERYARMKETLRANPMLYKVWLDKRRLRDRRFREMAKSDPLRYRARLEGILRRRSRVARFAGLTLEDYERSLADRGMLHRSSFDLSTITEERVARERAEMAKRDAELQERRSRFRSVEDAMRLPPDERFRLSLSWTDEERAYARDLVAGDLSEEDDLAALVHVVEGTSE